MSNTGGLNPRLLLPPPFSPHLPFAFPVPQGLRHATLSVSHLPSPTPEYKGSEIGKARGKKGGREKHGVRKARKDNGTVERSATWTT